MVLISAALLGGVVGSPFELKSRRRGDGAGESEGVAVASLSLPSSSPSVSLRGQATERRSHVPGVTATAFLEEVEGGGLVVEALELLVE